MMKRMWEMLKKDLTLFLLTRVHLIALNSQAYYVLHILFTAEGLYDPNMEERAASVSILIYVQCTAG